MRKRYRDMLKFSNSRCRDEKGTAIVEAALALPILFLLLGASIGLGYWVFQNTQIANAARDGDRVALLNHIGADANSSYQSCGGVTSFSSNTSLSGCSNLQTIQSAIAAHLGKVGFSKATVTCYSVGSIAPISCSTAQPFLDEIQVTVTVPASFKFFGPVFGSNGSVTRSVVTTIVGLPVAGQ